MVDSRPEELLGQRELQDEVDTAVPFTSTGSVTEAIGAAEHAIAVMFARLCLFASEDAKSATVSAALPMQQLAEIARRLFVGGKTMMNPVFRSKQMVSVSTVEQALETCATAEPSNLAALKAFVLELLRKPIGEQASTVSSESLEQIAHNFREFCRAADAMAGQG